MYKVIPIGARFTGKGHEQLANNLTGYEREGWTLVQVFPVLVTGCLGQATNELRGAHRVDSATTSSELPASESSVSSGQESTPADADPPYQRPQPGWARQVEETPGDTGEQPSD
jgi:hypothetical protein